MLKTFLGLGCAATFFMASSTQAAFLVQVDIDGLDDGPITYPANFSFGGDTTTASTSVAATTVGLAVGDSLFGGDGVDFPDTYVVTYTPAVDGDNIDLSGQALNTEGDIGSLTAAGADGEYAIYATWPATQNVNAAGVTFTLYDNVGVVFSVVIDQNTVQDEEGDGGGNEWIYLGSAVLDANTEYTLTQEANVNSFVSMRAAGYLFDAVPEPASLSLLGLGGLALLSRKGR